MKCQRSSKQLQWYNIWKVSQWDQSPTYSFSKHIHCTIFLFSTMNHMIPWWHHDTTSDYTMIHTITVRSKAFCSIATLNESICGFDKFCKPYNNGNKVSLHTGMNWWGCVVIGWPNIDFKYWDWPDSSTLLTRKPAGLSTILLKSTANTNTFELKKYCQY